jgi:hypothetical protein
MKTLNETLEEKLIPMNDALQALGGCRSIQALQHAIHAQEPTIKEAERFASSIAHVETREARQFRDAVRIIRATLEDRKETLQGVVTPAEVQFVTSETPNKPQPPANALILSRVEARDVRNYERATIRAKAEGKVLWVED